MVTPGTPPVPHVGGPVTGPGSVRTMIAGLPAARVGDLAACVGPPDSIVVGSFTVLIEGRPAARVGDQCAHGGVISAGCPQVMIGDAGSGSGSPQAATMSEARAAGAMFTHANCNLATPPSETAEPPEAHGERPSWVEIEILDDGGNPVPYRRFRLEAPGGEVREGTTDGRGLARVTSIRPGECRVTLIALDQELWDRR